MRLALAIMLLFADWSALGDTTETTRPRALQLVERPGELITEENMPLGEVPVVIGKLALTALIVSSEDGAKLGAIGIYHQSLSAPVYLDSDEIPAFTRAIDQILAKAAEWKGTPRPLSHFSFASRSGVQFALQQENREQLMYLSLTPRDPITGRDQGSVPFSLPEAQVAALRSLLVRSSQLFAENAVK